MVEAPIIAIESASALQSFEASNSSPAKSIPEETKSSTVADPARVELVLHEHVSEPLASVPPLSLTLPVREATVSQEDAVPSSPDAAFHQSTPVTADAQLATNSSGRKDRGLSKRTKGLGGLSVRPLGRSSSNVNVSRLEEDPIGVSARTEFEDILNGSEAASPAPSPARATMSASPASNTGGVGLDTIEEVMRKEQARRAQAKLKDKATKALDGINAPSFQALLDSVQPGKVAQGPDAPGPGSEFQELFANSTLSKNNASSVAELLSKAGGATGVVNVTKQIARNFSGVPPPRDLSKMN